MGRGDVPKAAGASQRTPRGAPVGACLLSDRDRRISPKGADKAPRTPPLRGGDEKQNLGPSGRGAFPYVSLSPHPEAPGAAGPPRAADEWCQRRLAPASGSAAAGSSGQECFG